MKLSRDQFDCDDLETFERLPRTKKSAELTINQVDKARDLAKHRARNEKERGY